MAECRRVAGAKDSQQPVVERALAGPSVHTARTRVLERAVSKERPDVDAWRRCEWAGLSTGTLNAPADTGLNLAFRRQGSTTEFVPADQERAPR